MKPITFENLRRLMGGGRKKKEKESSFKRSDSFKRISIRKSYLDRGKKKVISKLEVATQTVSEEELLGQIPEEVVQKVDSSVQVDKVDLNATIKSGKEILCNNYKRTKSVERRNVTGNSVVAYSQWLQEIKREDPPVTTAIKGSERTIIYVPASDDRMPSPVIRQLSSSPVIRKKNNTSTTHICNSPTSNLRRKESNDSAVEMFPWGDSTEVKKSPLVRKRSRQGPVSLLPTDSGTEEMCSLSISLGRIWMDAPQAMAPRSLEMPKSSATSTPPAHHSLDSALKDLRDDPLVSNRLQKRSTPPVTRTLSSTSNNTASTGLFSSKDSGFSFSISAPKLSDFHANFSPNGSKGFFRKKSKPKPKLSVSRDGYFKRTSSALVVDARRSSVRRRSSKKKKSKGKKNKNKEKDSGTIRSDIYQVICSRPQRVLTSLKLDPMIFVPPEKRKSGSQKPPFKTKMQEIRSFNPLDSNMYSITRSLDSADEGLYESLPGDYDYISDDEEINLESFSMKKKQSETTENDKKDVEAYDPKNVIEHEHHITSGYGVVRKYCKQEVKTREVSRHSHGGIDIVCQNSEVLKEQRNHHMDTSQNKCFHSSCSMQEEGRRYQKKKSDQKSNQKIHREEVTDQRTSCAKDLIEQRFSYRDPTNGLEDFSEEDSLVSVISDNFSDTDSEQCANVYVPPGVSPVPRRRPVRRKKSTGLSHKRSITYLVKPTVIRAPSTLKRSAKKIGQCVTDLTQTENLDNQASGSLNPEILSIIGDEGGNSKDYGPPIQQEVVNIWINIAKKGLDPDKRQGILNKYPCPENGMVLRALKLNPVVKEATTEAIQARDNRLSNLQAQIGSCLSAIGLVITDLLKEENGGNKHHIEHLSDTGRLLSDIHNLETISRRNLVSMNLNKDLKETLLDSPIDEWLFGENLEERLKTAKSLQVSSQQLKNSKPFNRRPGTARTSLNSRSPSYHKQRVGARQDGRYQAAPRRQNYRRIQQSRQQVRERQTDREKYGNWSKHPRH